MSSRLDPIAVVGIGCRFPGASGPRSFWALLKSGVNAVTEIPGDRLEDGGLGAGRIASRRGGFLEHVDRFDASFFGISPREAERMDPQQRILLEVSWEALEDAGLPAAALAGSATGVFIGMWTSDYEQRWFSDPAALDLHATTGTGRYAASGRVSYQFGFEGPSLTVDTGCSASLVAVHLACQSLRGGECELALAGGVNVIVEPQITVAYSRARMLSPEGVCRFGDASAQGYVRSEGAGVVVLKRLSAAIADGDPIYAVIRGSAVGNDGRTSGSFSTPGQAGQERVLRKACAEAGVEPGDVHYVEAHGTGTRAGDPVELGAIGRVFGAGRPASRPLWVGSVKTNIGHTESAAGVAGLVKVALSLRHGLIPPSLHFDAPNPAVSWQELALRIPTELVAWPSGERPALAGVSSFGISGTDAHVILEAPPPPAPHGAAPPDETDRARILPLSARSAEALTAMARSFADLLRSPDSPPLDDLCYTASVRRTHHSHRLALVGRGREELAERIETWIGGETSSARAPVADGARPRIAFVFPGQGSQWPGMGRSLLATEPAFRSAIEECDRVVKRYRPWSLLDALEGSDPSRWNEIDFIQPLLFCVEVALVALWRSWGIEPDALVGHSMGELAAAQAAGALGLDDAARVICDRSRLMKSRSGRGAMALVEISFDEAREWLRGYEDRLSVAVHNGPRSVVLSGDPAAVSEIVARLQAKEIFCRVVKVDVASHSPQMDGVVADLLPLLEGLAPRSGTIPLYSTVTGNVLDGARMDGSYWGRNLREPVLFSEAVGRLIESGHTVFVEMSPHPILTPSIQQIARELDRDCSVLASLRREEDERSVLLGSLGALYGHGYPIEWRALHRSGGRCIALPSYPWQGERFWREPQRFVADRGTSAQPTRHPLLGSLQERADRPGVRIWERLLDEESLPALRDHRVEDAAVLPASAYGAMALAASGAAEASGGRFEMQLTRPLFLPENEAPRIQTIVTAEREGAVSVRFYSRIGSAWVLHATARRFPDGAGPEAQPRLNPQEIASRCGRVLDGDAFYGELEERNARVGERLRGLDRVHAGEGEALGRCALADEAGRDVDPVLRYLDQGFQMAAFLADEASGGRRLWPVRAGCVRLPAQLETAQWVYARVTPAEAGAEGLLRLDLDWMNEDGSSIAWVRDLEMRAAGIGGETLLLAPGWELLPNTEQRERPEPVRFCILSDGGDVAEELARRLHEEGKDCVRSAPSAGALEKVLSAARRDPSRAPLHVVHLGGLDAPEGEDRDAERVGEAQEKACAAVIECLAPLTRRETLSDVRLWVVTRGAQRTGAERTAPLGAFSLWGLGRVIAREHPEVWGGLVDLDPASSATNAAEALRRAIAVAGDEDQLAVRGDALFVPRLVPRPRSPRESSAWRSDASYLVTGGFGALGLRVARHLVESGARRLILLGPTELPPRSRWSEPDIEPRLARRIEAVRALESLGAAVHLAFVDVANEMQVRGFVESYRAEGWPPIRGVLHAAGVVEDRLALDLDPASLRRVLGPKVRGAWALHRALEPGTLDFFVFFSSVGSLLGLPGQASYAAANAFLDGLAHFRRERGERAVSVNWGPWSEEGFAATPGGRRVSRSLAERGFGSLDAAEALGLLDVLLAEEAAQIAAVRLDRRAFASYHADLKVSRFLSPLAAGVSGKASGEPAREEVSWREKLRAASPEAARSLLAAHLRSVLAGVLQLAPDRVDAKRPFQTMGLDSILGIELRDRLEKSLGLRLSATLAWNYPTLTALAAHLADRLGGERPSRAAAPALPDGETPASAPAGAIGSMPEMENLSDEDALRALVELRRSGRGA